MTPVFQKQLKWCFEDYEVIIAGDRESAIGNFERYEPEGGDFGPWCCRLMGCALTKDYKLCRKLQGWRRKRKLYRHR